MPCSAGNSYRRKVCFDRQEGRYRAEIRFGGAGGASRKLYEINRQIFDRAGAFEHDDYKTERLIGEGGRKLNVSMLGRNMPGSDEMIGRNCRKLCPRAETVSFEGK